MRALFVFTPAESKRLIAKAVASMDVVKRPPVKSSVRLLIVRFLKMMLAGNVKIVRIHLNLQS